MQRWGRNVHSPVAPVGPGSPIPASPFSPAGPGHSMWGAQEHHVRARRLQFGCAHTHTPHHTTLHTCRAGDTLRAGGASWEARPGVVGNILDAEHGGVVVIACACCVDPKQRLGGALGAGLDGQGGQGTVDAGTLGGNLDGALERDQAAVRDCRLVNAGAEALVLYRRAGVGGEERAAGVSIADQRIGCTGWQPALRPAGQFRAAAARRAAWLATAHSGRQAATCAGAETAAVGDGRSSHRLQAPAHVLDALRSLQLTSIEMAGGAVTQVFSLPVLWVNEGCWTITCGQRRQGETHLLQPAAVAAKGGNRGTIIAGLPGLAQDDAERYEVDRGGQGKREPHGPALRGELLHFNWEHRKSRLRDCPVV